MNENTQNKPKAINYERIIEENFKVLDREKQIPVPFKLNNVQKKYLQMIYEKYGRDEDTGAISGLRDIILKARQQGMSSFILALFTVDFLFVPHSTSVCISHRQDSTDFLFKKVKFYIDCYIEKLAEKTGQDPDTLKKDFFQSNNKNLLENKLNKSSFYILTAGAKVGGRGNSARNVLFSESAFYQDTEMITAEEMIIATSQMVPQGKGMIFVETTANGEGNYFHKSWIKAINKDSAFRPVFFGSHEFYDQEWLDLKKKEFTNEKKFYQEYPPDWESAFVASGTPFFDITAVKDMQAKFQRAPQLFGRFSTGGYFEESEFEEDAMAKIYRDLEPDEQLVVFADPADGQDFCAAVVCSKKHYDMPIIFSSKIESSQFGYELYYLCNWIYKTTNIWPKLAIERNTGQATIHVLKELNYPDLFRMVDFTAEETGVYEHGAIGWTTTGYIQGGELKGTRRKMLDDFAMAVRQRMVTIYDKDVISQIKAFKLVNGRGVMGGRKHDDLLVSAAGAWQIQALTPDSNFDWYETEEQKSAKRARWRFK